MEISRFIECVSFYNDLILALVFYPIIQDIFCSRISNTNIIIVVPITGWKFYTIQRTLYVWFCGVVLLLSLSLCALMRVKSYGCEFSIIDVQLPFIYIYFNHFIVCVVEYLDNFGYIMNISITDSVIYT